ncbi:MAG: hypothetical protein ACYTEQ_06815 [Planctomycetota bacterium]|jgi:hypothetical protein
MKTKKFLFYLLAGILGGCVPVMSLHPLYTEQDVAFEEELLGVWVDDANEPDTTWEFRRPDASKKEYELIFSNREGKKGIFVTHLVKLKEQFFLDVYPKEFPCDTEDPNKTDWHFNAFFCIAAHTFIKIDCIKPLQAARDCLGEGEEMDEEALKSVSAAHDYVLKLRLTDDEEFKKLLEQNPNAVKHEKMEDDGVVLTASTRGLQEFVVKYAEDERLFTDATVLLRGKTKASQERARQDVSKGKAGETK